MQKTLHFLLRKSKKEYNVKLQRNVVCTFFDNRIYKFPLESDSLSYTNNIVVWQEDELLLYSMMQLVSAPCSRWYKSAKVVWFFRI